MYQHAEEEACSQKLRSLAPTFDISQGAAQFEPRAQENALPLTDAISAFLAATSMPERSGAASNFKYNARQQSKVARKLLTSSRREKAASTGTTRVSSFTEMRILPSHG
jgi:hypothetical protein